MVQLPSRKLAAIAAFAMASPMAAAQGQSQSRSPQWPVMVQDVRDAKAAEAQGAAGAQPQQPATAGSPASPPAASGWSEIEIATARARCNAILARYDAVATPMEPIREGECGSPYPVQLTSVAKVTLSQPAVVNCDVIATMHDWLTADVQPAARRVLGGRIARIDVLSSYSCRNAYGRKKSRLSEHGRANAIDIKAFHTDTQAVDLAADWGMTERDVKARIAAAEKAAREHAANKAREEAEALARARRHPSEPPAAVAGNSRPQATDRPGLSHAAEGFSALRGIVRDGVAGSDDDKGGNAFSYGQPSRLGGPKAKREASPAAQAGALPQAPVAGSVEAGGPDARQLFLRTLHSSACRRFGTVLGPEANEAHRNHFHLDVADRGGRGSFCE
ncbi:MAG: extensin family protein [Hyphomicrobiaceae bacterium]